jgi:HlyD family secretion protein
MKRTLTIILVVIGLIVGAFAIGWLYYRANPDEWTSFQAEMAGEERSTTSSSSASRPVIRPDRKASGDLIASGNIEAEEVTVAAEIGGRIKAIMADEGEQVAENDVLIQLDQSTLLAQREGAIAAVTQAMAAQAAAQAQLDLAFAGATPEEIAAGEAAVLVAEGAVAAAEAGLVQSEVNANQARTVQEAESSVPLAEANLAQAQGALDVANANLAAASAELARLQAGARPEEIAMYQSLVNQAQSNFMYYENIHFDNFISNDIGGAPEEQARYLREAARGAWDAAQAQLDMAKNGPTVQEINTASAAVSAARGQVAIAEAGVDAAEAELARAQAIPETTEDGVAIADAGVLGGDAQVDVAKGQLAQAEAELARLKAGATAEELATLQAQVAQAEAALAAAEAALKALDIQISYTSLAAPAGGVILQRLVHQGELAAPGAPLFTLADLDEVTLTVYVPEAELGKVALGQPVEVNVDAYDGLFPGEVSHIASQAEFTPKNVQTQEERVHMVFAVKIRLDNPDHLLKPGMPADAFFDFE